MLIPVLMGSLPKGGLACDLRPCLGSTQGIANLVPGGIGLTLGTSGNQPTWIQSGLSFDGGAPTANNDYVSLAAGYTNLLSGIDQWTVTFVITPYTVDNYSLLCTATTSLGLEIVTLNTGAVRINYNSGQYNSSASVFSAQPTVFTVTKNGTTITLYLNGVLIGSGTVGSLLTSSEDLKFGITAANSNSFKGNLHIGPIVHQQVLSANQVWATYRYLRQYLRRFGVSVP